MGNCCCCCGQSERTRSSVDGSSAYGALPPGKSSSPGKVSGTGKQSRTHSGAIGETPLSPRFSVLSGECRFAAVPPLAAPAWTRGTPVMSPLGSRLCPGDEYHDCNEECFSVDGDDAASRRAEAGERSSRNATTRCPFGATAKHSRKLLIRLLIINVPVDPFLILAVFVVRLEPAQLEAHQARQAHRTAHGSCRTAMVASRSHSRCAQDAVQSPSCIGTVQVQLSLAPCAVQLGATPMHACLRASTCCRRTNPMVQRRIST